MTLTSMRAGHECGLTVETEGRQRNSEMIHNSLCVSGSAFK